ncbi:MAG: metallophosphoesterase [Candidatus Helarchaeota archaeon]|nr:metallophosphoesterase [Candidatus Helarchaeota archaeon]
MAAFSAAGFAQPIPAWKFIITADCRSASASDHNGVNVAILSEIVAEVINHNVDFFLFCGDLAIGTADQQELEKQFLTWRKTMQPVYQAGIPVYMVRGNHDAVSYPSCITAWNNVFKDETASGGFDYSLPQNGPLTELNLTYYVAHKNALILALDELRTPSHPIDYVNQTWIDTQLAANTRPHVFAFGHFTAFKMIWDSLGDHPDERNLFWNGLENAGARTYFCGHEHFFDCARVDDDGDPNNDLYQYIIGSAGAPEHVWNEDNPYPGNNSGRTITPIYHTTGFGYVIVDINDLNVTLTWMERQTNDPEIPGTYSAMDVLSYTVACGDAAHPYPLADFNKDCYVDGFDFAIIAEQWLQTSRLSADIAPSGGDQVVNWYDLAVFTENWLNCTAPDCY